MHFKSVLCILTALKYESEPIIDHYGLARDKTFDFPVFRSGSMVLLGIGVGKKFIKTRICEFYAQKQGDEEYQFVNIGIAGGNPASTALGVCYMVNKIYDERDKIYYYPDLPARHPFQERAIVTVEQGIINGGSEYAELVDMESSGIFQVCRALDPEQRLAFIKIVSDHMDLNKVEFKKNIISKLISNNMNTIDSFLKSCYFEEY
ncbi:MAG: hypothetical protein VX497_02020 [Candidatus Neomarinimicrobiota bacterium]|nr:hypothetical protein [Candidatus Neomarinimicrobiota bacterium]